MIESREQFFSAAPKRKTIELDVGSEKMVFSELSVKDRYDYFELKKDGGVDVDKAAAFVLVRSSSFLSDDDIEQVVKMFSPESLALISHQILALSGMIKTYEEEEEKK